MVNHSRRSWAGLVAVVSLLAACNEPCPNYSPNCTDGPTSSATPAVLAQTRPARYAATSEAPSGIRLTASTGNIRSFLGQDSFKLILAPASDRHLYLLLPASDTSLPPIVLRLDRGDEGPNGNVGWPNEPQFSPDGRWVAFAGSFSSSTNVYIREAVPGTGWRVPVIRSAGTSAAPHWYKGADALNLVVSDVEGTTAWNGAELRNNGATWMSAFHDSTIDSFVPAKFQGNPVPGAFKGGVSRDGKWLGTSYQTSVLWNAQTGTARVLNGGYQQCNPSMNPFESGANTDFMMILGFGGSNSPVPTPSGPVLEGQHENLWVWTKDDQAVWRARLPNVAPHPSDEVPGVGYEEWQRPRWSTHPDFATALALRAGTEQYDLLIVKMSDLPGALANADRSRTLERGPVLRVAAGPLTSTDWSHLWVKP